MMIAISVIDRHLTTRTKDWKRRGEEGLIEITTNQSDPHASD
jgi:hypothetical protein